MIAWLAGSVTYFDFFTVDTAGSVMTQHVDALGNAEAVPLFEGVRFYLFLDNSLHFVPYKVDYREHT